MDKSVILEPIELTDAELDAVSGGDKPQEVTYYRAGKSDQLFTEQHGNKEPVTFRVH